MARNHASIVVPAAMALWVQFQHPTTPKLSTDSSPTSASLHVPVLLQRARSIAPLNRREPEPESAPLPSIEEQCQRDELAHFQLSQLVCLLVVEPRVHW